MPDTKKLKITPDDFLTDEEVRKFSEARKATTSLLKQGFMLAREHNAIQGRITKARSRLIFKRLKDEKGKTNE